MILQINLTKQSFFSSIKYCWINTTRSKKHKNCLKNAVTNCCGFVSLCIFQWRFLTITIKVSSKIDTMFEIKKKQFFRKYEVKNTMKLWDFLCNNKQIFTVHLIMIKVDHGVPSLKPLKIVIHFQDYDLNCASFF